MQSHSDLAAEAESQSWAELASLAEAMAVEEEWTDAQPREPPQDLGEPPALVEPEAALPSSPTGESQQEMALRMLRLVQQKACELLGGNPGFQD